MNDSKETATVKTKLSLSLKHTALMPFQDKFRLIHANTKSNFPKSTKIHASMLLESKQVNLQRNKEP